MSHHNYDAYWIPGLDTDFDEDDALALGYDWLRDSGLSPVIVLYAASMIDNRPLLAQMAARVPVVSPRTRTRTGLGGSPHAVLAVWPPLATLEFAEKLASRGALCVIPGFIDEVSAWMARTKAVNLADPDAPPVPGPALSDDVKKALNSTLFFDGHNSFVGGGGKEHAVRTLREIAAMTPRPTPEEIEVYALESGETTYKGGARLAEWYKRILEGRNLRDYRGRPI